MKLTQCERILRHLQDYEIITRKEAINEYGIYRLASRISDLKRMGYQFEVSFGTGKNRYNEPTHFAIYRLISTPNT